MKCVYGGEQVGVLVASFARNKGVRIRGEVGFLKCGVAIFGFCPPRL